MTTRTLLCAIAAVTACRPSPRFGLQPDSHEPSSVSGDITTHERVETINPRAEEVVVYRGQGFGHVVPDVNLKQVIITVDSPLSYARYCEDSTPEVNERVEVSEVVTLDTGEEVRYLIRRLGAAWTYAIRDDDGETPIACERCASCHESGRPSPFFRPPSNLCP